MNKLQATFNGVAVENFDLSIARNCRRQSGEVLRYSYYTTS
jgi:hypothetical protein